MKTKIRLFIPFVLSVVCFAASAIIGSTVDSMGFLREPFFLIPTAYLFLAAALIQLTIHFSIKLYKNRKKAKVIVKK